MATYSYVWNASILWNTSGCRCIATRRYRETRKARLGCPAGPFGNCICGVLSRQSAFGLLNDRGEGGGFVYGQIGQNLAVHFDAGQAEAVDEAAVCQRLIV